ncbi:nickel/cobalt transporter [Kitasatospora sp. NPDC088346]|uniref:nickel/cobalt transporter n=1 Tax=Kitasatospora sp. NPDC088346 TaxID=3364073 RepID=UPI0037F77B67
MAATAAGALWLLCSAAPDARAHPLGNFSVNHYTGLTVHADRLDALAVTDTAEIPTLQAAPAVDIDGDGTPSEAERSAWATARCAETAGRLAVTAPQRLAWTVGSAAFDYRDGQAGLRTSRLTCHLSAPLDLGTGPVTLRVDTGADPARVGWNEITATGEGAHLDHSTVPAASSSDELRNYPRELLDTPRGDTTAGFTATAGDGPPSLTDTGVAGSVGHGLTARMEALSRKLTVLAGAERLTVPVGLLAVLLSVVLGVGHALLPGHGKTVMAAYLAGRRGRPRDAVTVGATVTATHTTGVLVIGLALTTFSSLAGDTVLGWLGVVSGALVALVGAGLLADALRPPRAHRRSPEPAPEAARRPALLGAGAPAAHTHDHPHPHPHPHGDHQHHRRPTDHHHEHAHGHGHGHSHDGHRHGHDHGRPHRHGLLGGHRHAHGPASAEARPFTTRGLVGLGIAGGLVPSPSALVVLLGAVALGRTLFGAALVVAYGIGMAATLTAVGLLLVRFGDRLGPLAHRPSLALLRRIAPHTAALTAALVLMVGVGLMVRSLPPVL